MKKIFAKYVGLTGGIGSGKSSASAMFAQLGAYIVDVDAISRSLTEPNGLAVPAIERAFGPKSLDQVGGMNRLFMRELIFNDAQARQRLEAIVHPLIKEGALALAAQALPEQRVIYDVPLLVEALPFWHALLDCIVVVDCLPPTQIHRVMTRSGWPRQLIEQVMAQQCEREQRLAVAHYVLDNEGVGLTNLNQQINALWDLWNNAI